MCGLLGNGQKSQTYNKASKLGSYVSYSTLLHSIFLQSIIQSLNWQSLECVSSTSLPYKGVVVSKNSIARLAGLFFLAVVLTGIFNLIYVPSQLIVWGDAAVTANNILNSELLFRFGIVSGVLCYISFFVLPFILYRLFESVDKNYAFFMVALAVVSVPISIFNMINKVDVLTLLSGAEYLSAFDAEQIHAQVMLLLRSYNNGISVVQIFWGLWLFPFGYLVYKSGFLPKIFGILLMVGCFGYLIKFFGYLLFPNFAIPLFIELPASLGEIGICLWLLIMGVKDKPVEGTK